MRCLYVSSEVTGFAKTGGLADVSASLPPALAERGIEVAVVMPFYKAIRQGGHRLKETTHKVKVALGNRVAEGRIWQTVLPNTEIPVFLVENEGYFERDDVKAGRGIYQYTDHHGNKVDYHDNFERYLFFNRAVLEALPLLDYWPDVIHANDWQTGLIPVLVKENYSRMGKPAWRHRYELIKTLFTIHNLAYQGNFWHHDLYMLNLPGRLFNADQLEFHGNISFLKAGIVFADAITTVSPTYAREIQTSYYGCGLQGVLLGRCKHLSGIVNGIDETVWNPATDRHLPSKYDRNTFLKGKPECKRSLQKHYQLEANPAIPLLGIVSRLATQKGLDLLQAVAPWLMAQNIQLVVLGQGEQMYHEFLHRLQQAHPKQVGIAFDLSEAMAHQIEAGSDLFLMPSQYEPCGLNQLYSLKYGTVPVVRSTGGLADTVVDATEANIQSGTATGFSFVQYSPEGFQNALARALTMYRQQPERWKQLQHAGMSQDWSWNRSAAEYEKCYRSLLSF